METDCRLCHFILTRLGELHGRHPAEPGFSAYTILHDGANALGAGVAKAVTTRELDVHIGRHLRDEVLVVQTCCTARNYRLASMGVAPNAC